MVLLAHVKELEMKNEFMVQALKCAKKALSEGEVPIGAVVVLDGKVISRATQSSHEKAGCYGSRGDRSNRKGLQKIKQLAYSRM